MSSTKSLLSSSENTNQGPPEDIERMGYLKKMKVNNPWPGIAVKKTMKKKYFVLRKEGLKFPARLEYYDSEKKFKSGQSPKRSIELKKCFNINKRDDTKLKHCLALYTKDDCFCLVLESAEEASDWLKSLLELQHGGATEPGEVPKPAFEFVWQVKVQEKGLGASRDILGPYRVCLTAKSLSLLKMGCKDEIEEEKNTYEFSLASIRRCGSSQCFFYMEVGRSTVTGAGELWMVTEDPHIATHMHNAIMTAMSGGSKGPPTGATPPTGEVDGELGPKPRNRSYSTNEASKPQTIQRRQTHGNDSLLSLGYFTSGTTTAGSTAPGSDSTVSLLSSQTASPATTEHNLGMSVSSGSRERCDSLPCAPRTRTTSEGYALPPSSAPHHPRLLSHPHHPSHHHSGHHASSVQNFLTPAARPHSMYARGMSYSPPIDCSPVSPVSGGCSTDSAGSSLSIDETDGGSLLWGGPESLHQHQPCAACSLQITRSLTDSIGGSTPPSRYSGLDNGRYGALLLSPDDSIPDSIVEENSAEYLLWGSHISEEEQQEYMPMDRPSANLSLPLTSVTSSRQSSSNLNNNNKYSSVKSGSPSQSSYMDMSSPLGLSPSDPSGRYMIMSPGTDVTPQASAPPSFPRSSGLYISGAGSVGSANHSRASSLAEDTPGYVPMAPSSQPSQAGSHTGSHHHDDGYVDMEPDHSRGESLGGSSCSLTSGTPSMTNAGEHSHRFSSEFHLEKVSSYFTPSEDEEDHGSATSGSLPRQEGPQPRSARAYSLGSKPDSMASRRNRLDVIQQDAIHSTQPSRARACSMGAQQLQRPVSSPRAPMQAAQRHHSPISMTGSLTRKHRTSAPSGPFLSSSWSGTTGNTASHRVGRRLQPSRNHPHASLEPIGTDDNLMEMDFSGSKKDSSSSDYLDMEINPVIVSDKVPTSPIFEEYVDMRKTISKPIDLPKKSSVLPLWGSRSSSNNDPERISPNRGSPNRNNSDDYLNMKCVRRGASQPINIATNQPTGSSSKSSTSPVLFSLAGLLSRKNSSSTGTPPKVPERSNSPSPFSSLRRRGKKNSKKNKDKRSSISSDDTSNVTTPVGVFPFSPSTPSKSFVPEEQFAKCSIDASSGGVRLTEDNSRVEMMDTTIPQSIPNVSMTSQNLPHSYTNYKPSTEPDYVTSKRSDSSDLTCKRKVSAALQLPILGQSGGKTVVIGAHDSLQAPNTTRPRSSSSECEYVPMHPSSSSSSRRKYSDIAGYSTELGATGLDNTRKCASDNLLDSGTTDYAPNISSTGRNIREDYAMMRPLGRNSEDYAVMSPSSVKDDKGRKLSSSLLQQPSNDYALINQGSTSPRIITAGKTPEFPSKSMHQSSDYALMQPGTSNVSPSVIRQISQSKSSSDDYALMSPGIANTPPKFSGKEQKSNTQSSSNDDYAMMMIPGISRTPPKFSGKSSNTEITTSKLDPTRNYEMLDSRVSGDYSMTTPCERLETLKENVATTNDSDDYALLTPQSFKSSDCDYSLMSITPPTKVISCSSTSSKSPENLRFSDFNSSSSSTITSTTNTPSKFSESSVKSNSRLEDYALMIPGDGISSPRLLEEEQNQSIKNEKTLSSSSLNKENVASGFTDYALMKPGENIIEYESKFKCVQQNEEIQDSGDYAILAPGKGFNLGSKLPVVQEQKYEDYALMAPGKISEDKSVKDKKNTETLQKSCEVLSGKSKESSPPPSLQSLLRPSETRKSPSPSREESDDYVLMTPAIKPPMLPTRDAPISLHLNNPTTALSPLVVMPSAKVKSDENTTMNKPQVSSASSTIAASEVKTTSDLVPEPSTTNLVPNTEIKPSSSFVNVPVSTTVASTSMPSVLSQQIVPKTTMSSALAIIPSLSVVTSTKPHHPIVTKSSSIPLPATQKTIISTPPIHIPNKNISKIQTPQQKNTVTTRSSTLPKPISSKPIPVSTPNTSTTSTVRTQVPKQNKPTNKYLSKPPSSNNNNNNKSIGNKQQQQQVKTAVNRRSASKSPLPSSQPELNYASLDLPQCQESLDECSGAPALARNLSSDSSGESDVTCVGTTYAQIDFVRTQQQSKKLASKQDRKT